MTLGFSQKRLMIMGPLLLAAASCVPARAVDMTGASETLAAGVKIQAAAPEWAKLEPGMPYRLFEKAVAPARPFTGEAQSEEDKLRSLDCLAQAVYYEAASESEDGQRAVAQVVLNRVRHPTYPNSVCGVVYQGSHLRTGCQFTFTCDGSLARRPSAFAWARARRIAAEMLAGEVYGPVGIATHYHTNAILPYWAHSLTRAAVVGAHVFYRWRGSQGRSEAFTQRYAGVEPGAAALPPSFAQVPASLAAATEVEAGVRKWTGVAAGVRIHRGSSAAPMAAAEAADAGGTFGVQIHRGSSADVTS